MRESDEDDADADLSSPAGKRPVEEAGLFLPDVPGDVPDIKPVVLIFGSVPLIAGVIISPLYVPPPEVLLWDELEAAGLISLDDEG